MNTSVVYLEIFHPLVGWQKYRVLGFRGFPDGRIQICLPEEGNCIVLPGFWRNAYSEM